MRTLKLVLASIALTFSLFIFAQDTEMAMITEFELTETSDESILSKEISMAKRNNTTKSARFRANANYTNVGGCLSKHLQFPDEARVLGVSGEVKVAFDILPDGSIANMEVLESPLDLFSEELISVMQSMPNWSPAFRDGLPVESRQEIHVNFRLP
jgi:TonB family protein